MQYHLWDQGSFISELKHPWWDTEDFMIPFIGNKNGCENMSLLT